MRSASSCDENKNESVKCKLDGTPYKKRKLTSENTYCTDMDNSHVPSGVHNLDVKKDRLKNNNTIASKMKQVVDKLIESQKKNETRSLITIFLYKSQQSEIISSFLHEMRKENTNLFNDRSQFFTMLMDKYDDLMLTLNDKYPCGSRKQKSRSTSLL